MRTQLRGADRGPVLDLAGLLLVAILALWAGWAGESVDADPSAIQGLLLATAACYFVGRLLGAAKMPIVALAVAGGALLVVILAPRATLSDGPLDGLFGYANAKAAFFAQATIAALMVWASLRNPQARTGALAAAGILAAVPLASDSMVATVLVLGLGAMAMYVRGANARRSFVLICLGLFLAAVALTYAIGALHREGTTTRLESLVAETLSPRRPALWHDAINVMTEHPITGVGPGRFVHASPVAASDRDTRWAHNEFLQQGAELGVVGFVGLALLFVWALLRALLAPVVNRNVALVAASVAILGIHASMDYILHFPAVPLIAAALLGTGVASAKRRSAPAIEQLDWKVYASQ